MRLIPLFTMRHRQIDAAYSDPLPGGARVGFATGTGDVHGERIRGTLRRSNRPEHLADGTELPDSHGVITTVDGALVFVDATGQSAPPEPGRAREGFISLTFRTTDDRYRWLNAIFAIGERVGTSRDPVEYRVFECRAG